MHDLDHRETAFGVELTRSRVVAEGDLDFRGTLGVAKDAPVGFRDIRGVAFSAIAAFDNPMANAPAMIIRFSIRAP